MKRALSPFLFPAALLAWLVSGASAAGQESLLTLEVPLDSEKSSLRPPIVIVDNEVPLKITDLKLDSRSGKATLTIENLSEKEISAWTVRQVSVTPEGTGASAGYSEDYNSGNVPGGPGMAPGAVFERSLAFGREGSYRDTNILAIHVVVSVIIYQDNSYVGSEEAAQRFFRTRGQRLLETERWLRVVEALVEKTPRAEDLVPALQELVERVREERSKTPGALQANTLLLQDLELVIGRAPKEPGAAFILLEGLTRDLRESSEKLRRAVPPAVLAELKDSKPVSGPDSLKDISGDASGSNCSISASRARSEENDCTFLGDGSGDHNISESWNFACSPAPNSDNRTLDGFGKCCKRCGTTEQNIDCPPMMGPTSEDFTTQEGQWGRFWQRSAIDKKFVLEGGVYKCQSPGSSRSIDMFCPCPEESDGGGTEGTTECNCTSPILIDRTGGGFRFVGLEDAVHFDIDADGEFDTISWSDPSSDEAFLALDRNGNGSIDNGRELFGSVTPQPESTDPNGFLALAVFDAVEHGGNEDGWISASDAVFSSLLLWRDANHDGVSQPTELISLGLTDVRGIELSYVRSERRDRHGNLLRWTSFVEFAKNKRRAAADVIFLREEAASP